MPYFFPNYFGDEATIGGVVRAAIVPGIPISIRVRNLLQDDIPSARVYDDFAQSSPGEDAIAVSAIGGEWIMAATIRQRKTRTVRVECRSDSSERAMQLQESVVASLRRSVEIIIMAVSDVTGGYDYDTQAFYQTMDFDLRR